MTGEVLIDIRLQILNGRSDKQILRKYQNATTALRQERKQMANMGIQPGEDLLGTEQAAYVLGIGDRWVRKLCESGRLGKKVGAKAYVITAGELNEFAKKERPSGGAGAKALREDASSSHN